jgi:DNA-directed RNA polymerase subunit alpha
MKHLTVIGGVEAIPAFAIDGDDVPDEPLGRKPELYDKPIEELDLSVRVFNSLKRTGITTIGDVLDMLQRGPDAMLAIRNFGEKSLDELVAKLRDKGYLADDVEFTLTPTSSE